MPPNADEIFEKVFLLTCDELLASLKQMSSLDKMVRCWFFHTLTILPDGKSAHILHASSTKAFTDFTTLHFLLGWFGSCSLSALAQTRCSVGNRVTWKRLGYICSTVIYLFVKRKFSWPCSFCKGQKGKLKKNVLIGTHTTHSTGWNLCSNWRWRINSFESHLESCKLSSCYAILFFLLPPPQLEPGGLWLYLSTTNEHYSRLHACKA